MGGRGSSGGGKGGAGGSMKDRVLDAVREAAGKATGPYKGDRVPIADVRDEMAREGVSGADFDRALMALHDDGKVLVQSSNAPRMLTQRQRDGGIRFGGKNNEIVGLS